MARQLGSTIPFALWALIAVGCKSGPDEPPLRLDTMLSKQTVTARSTSLALRPEKSQPGPSFGATASSGGVRKKLSQTANSFKNAMTIQPKVVPAGDPTSLSSDPGPISPDLYVSAASVLEQQNRNADAAAKYQQALAVDANHREALIGLARLRHREGNLDEAIQVYQRAIVIHPDDPVLLNDLGLCYARAGQPEMAQSVLQRAVELSPSSPLYRNNLAAVLVESDRSAEAVPMLAESYGTAVAHYNVGYLLHKRGDDSAAIDHFVSSLQANPALEPARAMLHQLSPQLSQRVVYPTTGEHPPVHNASSSRSASGESTVPVNGNTDSGERTGPSVPRPAPQASWPARPAAYSVPATASEQAVFTAPMSTDPRENILGENAVVTVAALADTGSPTVPEVLLPGLVRLPLPSRGARKPGHLVPPAPCPVKPAFQADFLPTFEGSDAR